MRSRAFGAFTDLALSHCVSRVAERLMLVLLHRYTVLFNGVAQLMILIR